MITREMIAGTVAVAILSAGTVGLMLSVKPAEAQGTGAVFGVVPGWVAVGKAIGSRPASYSPVVADIASCERMRAATSKYPEDTTCVEVYIKDFRK